MKSVTEYLKEAKNLLDKLDNSKEIKKDVDDAIMDMWKAFNGLETSRNAIRKVAKDTKSKQISAKFVADVAKIEDALNNIGKSF